MGEEKTMRESVQDALDDLCSVRSSDTQKSEALLVLEEVLALVCVSSEHALDLQAFSELQDTFECNVPSRLLMWISQCVPQLDCLTEKDLTDQSHLTEAVTVAIQIAQALSLMQGVSLIHKASKLYLGRRPSMEILIDLLLGSRHVPHLSPSAARPASRPTSPLTSVVLDTLLCILVDYSLALRTFEDVGGVQAVVKILKRANTPREVRMKCLEFLYFYLLDENTSSSIGSFYPRHCPPSPPISPLKAPSGIVTVPNTPRKPKSSSKVLVPGLGRPTRTSSDSMSSSGSSSGSRFSSFSDVSSTSSQATAASTSSEEKSTEPGVSQNVPQSITFKTPVATRLSMLRRDIDYTPQSPVKASLSPFVSSLSLCLGHESDVNSSNRDGRHVRTRTTEEKKELLGGLLGNVDALVEGVKKAGIWGLG